MSKVQYGLSNVHLSTRTDSGGSISYGTPVAFPGAVNLNLSATQADATFYADNIVYFKVTKLTALEGELEMALIPDSIKTAYLGYIADDDGNLAETNAVGAPFALLAQVEQDDYAGKICFYNCVFGRPSTEHSTVEDTISVQTVTIPITITGETVTIDGESVQVFSRTAEHGDTNYASFFSTVAIPTFS